MDDGVLEGGGGITKTRKPGLTQKEGVFKKAARKGRGIMGKRDYRNGQSLYYKGIK